MPAATASAVDVSRTEQTDRHERSDRNNSVPPQAQCTPMPLPAVGTQRILHGNGTIVGTVIALQCPAKHKLIGGDLTCVMGPNSTHWVGETYCKPLSPYGDYGFRVAVLASIVSSAIIFLMSVAFITCCVLDCIKEDNRKEQERETEMWHREEPTQNPEQQRSRYGHKGRNNNNNAHEKMLPLQDNNHPSICTNGTLCRCQQSYIDVSLVSALPGLNYNQPLQDPGPPQGSETLLSSTTLTPGRIQTASILQHYERQQRRSPQFEPNIRNTNIHKKMNPKESSIRVISV